MFTILQGQRRDSVVELIGKTVEVLANEISYTGKLVEIGEEEVYLQTQAGWIVIPVERIVSIRKKEE